MPVLLKYWKVIVVSLLLAGTFSSGVYVEKSHRDAKDTRREAGILKEVGRLQERSNDLETKLLETERQRDASNAKLKKKLVKIVERPIYSGQCIDDDGRLLINKYLKGAPATRINGTMSGSDAP